MTSRTQPIEAPSGLGYGEHKALEDAQREIPLPANTPQPTSGGTPNREAPVQRPDVFGPTQRENEPITAGASEGAGPVNPSLLPDDPHLVLRAAILDGYDRDGSIRRLLERWKR